MLNARFFRSALLCSVALFGNHPALAETSTPAAIPAAVPAAVQGASLSEWQVLQDKSSIEWAANYSGKTITGSFKDFTSNIVFDPAHLDASHVLVTIDIAKVSSDDKDAEAALPGAEWFDSAKNPHATFEAKIFRHLEDEKYEADGTLTLGERHGAITLPFTAHFYNDNETAPPVRYAQITGDTTIKRTDYGIGKGDWIKTDAVADEVKVTINLKAKAPAVPAP